jgi:acetyl-CoA C-acetyltransferase
MADRRRRAFIVSVARTPFGRFGGALASVPGPGLAALAIDEVLRRQSIEAARVEAVYAGIGMIGGAALTATRQAVLGSASTSGPLRLASIAHAVPE